MNKMKKNNQLQQQQQQQHAKNVFSYSQCLNEILYAANVILLQRGGKKSAISNREGKTEK